MTAPPPPRPATLAPGTRVLVAGGYGMGNLGDEAMLAGLLNRATGCDVSVVSAAPAETARMHRVRAVSVRSATAELLRCQTLVIGGGSLFSGHMGKRGRGIPAFGLAALAARKSVLLLGIGVDRTTPGPARPLVAWLARGAGAVEVRDRTSARLLGEWGARSEVAPDLSAWLEPAPESRAEDILRAAGLQREAPVVGLCPANVEPGLEEPLLEAIPHLVGALPDVQFCILPMSRHPNAPRHDDLRLATELQRRAPRLTVLDGGYHPAEAAALFRCFSAAVCLRYHSLLFARRAGTPIIAVPYAEKCRIWLEERALPAHELHGPSLVQTIQQILAPLPNGPYRPPAGAIS